jgi:hypothetical protein
MRSNFCVATAPDYIRAILSMIDSDRTMALRLFAQFGRSVRRYVNSPIVEPGFEVFIPVVKWVDKGHASFQSGDATAAKQYLTMALALFGRAAHAGGKAE